MFQLLLMLHVFVAIALVGLVLVQQGKGASVGASFGSGASSTVFGSRGPAGFLFKLTMGLGLLFFVTSVSLTSYASYEAKAVQTDIINSLEQK